MFIYTLTSENLTNLGGPMGTEYTYPNWVKVFKTVAAAKKYAAADYRRNTLHKMKWEWIKEGTGFRTPDLGFVMYHIKKEKVLE